METKRERHRGGEQAVWINLQIIINGFFNIYHYNLLNNKFDRQTKMHLLFCCFIVVVVVVTSIMVVVVIVVTVHMNHNHFYSFSSSRNRPNV